MTGDRVRLDAAIASLTDRLVEALQPAGHWQGRLASSALSTATAVVALERARQAGVLVRGELAAGGIAWLVRAQNADGGWGDTVRSRSNLSTTLLAWAALSLDGGPGSDREAARARAAGWLRGEIGEPAPARLRDALLARYGRDRTFSAPILAMLAIAGRLGDGPEAWRQVPQLPFELAACPHRWFQWIRLPVVSYALPALIAIGQVRHAFAPTRVAPLRALRDSLAPPTRAALLAMQPASGGYLEATPLTSFVVMSLVAAGHARHDVVAHGLAFLASSVRDDGSWPIDTNLATWVTTLAVNAFGPGGPPPSIDRARLLAWLLDQQQLEEHPFTHAAPGGWAWTDLPGGVPDADDTAGALIALRHLDADARGARVREAARRGVAWLLDLQNRDGGIPTFCHGWGALPFDRSAPDLTAHALQAWAAWQDALDGALPARVSRAAARACGYLVRAQRPEGSWLPLWFGNERAPHEGNPVYGTARVAAALASLPAPPAAAATARARGERWLLDVQRADGGWGGDRGVSASIEETGVALHAIARCARAAPTPQLIASARRAAEWLAAAAAAGAALPAAPIGLYFARLWYFEELYPIVFALGGLVEARRLLHGSSGPASRG